MITHTGYADALKAVDAHYGSASDFMCIHCTDKASRWVVDNSVSATVDPQFRRYSDKPTDYWPFCPRHAHDYETCAGDWPPVVFRRVSTFEERHWFVDCFTAEPGASVLLRDAYATYLDYCREERVSALEIMTRNTFKASLLRRGGKHKRTNDGVAIDGIRLRSN
ncbi:hypothetical protein E6R61_05725 [Streptomyces sp. LRa12]|uniref:hypothetical protein n=1 Tax=Streptomyces sp. LRa12 TaxID=2563107 RepID=UPI00109E8BDD|nr:hypothetical protein [Streptomyces sp. LRa12]THA98844.1 hypothetical protein E6R61_05725 [Streptomyces sp. LRa12]